MCQTAEPVHPDVLTKRHVHTIAYKIVVGRYIKYVPGDRTGDRHRYRDFTHAMQCTRWVSLRLAPIRYIPYYITLYSLYCGHPNFFPRGAHTLFPVTLPAVNFVLPQVTRDGVGMTARNSLSFQRPVVASNASAKGDPNNLPFWPG